MSSVSGKAVRGRQAGGERGLCCSLDPHKSLIGANISSRQLSAKDKYQLKTRISSIQLSKLRPECQTAGSLRPVKFFDQAVSVKNSRETHVTSVTCHFLLQLTWESTCRYNRVLVLGLYGRGSTKLLSQTQCWKSSLGHIGFVCWGLDKYSMNHDGLLLGIAHFLKLSIGWIDFRVYSIIDTL